jgi:hypothetical protein
VCVKTAHDSGAEPSYTLYHRGGQRALRGIAAFGYDIVLFYGWERAGHCTIWRLSVASMLQGEFCEMRCLAEEVRWSFLNRYIIIVKGGSENEHMV